MKLKVLTMMIGLLSMAWSLQAEMPSMKIAGTDNDQYQAINEELIRMIRFPELNLNPREEIQVQIRFELDDNEMIHLLDVSGSSEFIRKHVWSDLDGKKLNGRQNPGDKIFYTTVRFQG